MQNKIRSLSEYGEGGWIEGKKHSEGGTVIEAERGEFVARASAAGKSRKLLEAINDGRVDDKNFDIWKMNIRHLSGNTKTDSFGEVVESLEKGNKLSEQMLSTLKENETTAVNLGDGRVMIIRGKYNTQIVTLK
jgi:hypothetical protein